MKENRAVSTITHPPRVNDWVWVKRSTDPKWPGCPVTGPARIANNDSNGLMVEFPSPDPKLHDGNGFVEGKANRCWFVMEEQLAPLPMEFCVFRDGDTTYCLRGDKRSVTGKAEFSATESGEFDPLVGAIIAMARAYGRAPTEVAYKVLTALSAVPVPGPKTAASNLEERVSDLEERVDFLTDWCTALTDDLEKRAEHNGGPVKPQAETKKRVVIRGPGGKNYGVVGTPTKFKTDDGVPLKVGDRVYLEPTDPVDTWSEIKYITVMVEDEENGAFPMGLRADVTPETGEVRNWRVTLHPEQLKAGDSFDIGPGRFTLKEVGE